MTRTQGFILTYAYAAPEQWNEMPAEQMDGRTDLYALGCVLYEMLTGTTPFHAHTTAGWMKQHCEESPKPPSTLRPEVAHWSNLDALVSFLLAKNRERRPESATETLSLLAIVKPNSVRHPQLAAAENAKPRQTVAEPAAIKPAPIFDPRKPPTLIDAPPPPFENRKLNPPSVKFPAWRWGGVGASALVILLGLWWLVTHRSNPQPSQPAMVQQQAKSKSVGTEEEPQIPSQQPIHRPSSAPKVEPTPTPTTATVTDAERQAESLDHEKRYGEAAKLYARACDDGNADACYNLAGYYSYGLSVGADFSKAIYLYSKSCENGKALACSVVGDIYRNGERGLPKNLDEAKRYYKKGCDLGSSVACGGLRTL